MAIRTLPNYEYRSWGNPQMEEYQQMVGDIVQRMQSLPFWNGEQVTVENVGVSGSGATFTVQHSLGRVPRGFILVSGTLNDGSSNVGYPYMAQADWDVTTTTSLQARINGLWDSVTLWIW